MAKHLKLKVSVLFVGPQPYQLYNHIEWLQTLRRNFSKDRKYQKKKLSPLSIWLCRSVGVNEPLGLVFTKRQRQRCDNSAMTLAILFSLKTM